MSTGEAAHEKGQKGDSEDVKYGITPCMANDGSATMARTTAKIKRSMNMRNITHQ